MKTKTKSKTTKTKMKAKTTKTGTATGIIDVTTQMGDKFNDKWKINNLNNDAKMALSAYKVAITTAKHQAVYRKESGIKRKISFFN